MQIGLKIYRNLSGSLAIVPIRCRIPGGVLIFLEIVRMYRKFCSQCEERLVDRCRPENQVEHVNFFCPIYLNVQQTFPFAFVSDHHLHFYCSSTF